MRGSLAAACAAVLVGLSPAGALPFASFAAAAATRIEAPCGRVESPRATSGQEEARGVAVETVVARRADASRAPAVFSSPSGPAPSQAPPAR